MNARAARGNTRFTATEIRKLLTAVGGHTDWRGLVDASQAVTPREITQLRQMLKGLERVGEIRRDLSGHYHLLDDGSATPALETGIVAQAGAQQTVSGYKIEHSRVPLRAGDEIEFRAVGDNALVARVVQHSLDPLVGLLNTEGRYPCVEGLGTFKQRIELEQPPHVGKHGDTVVVRVTGLARRNLRGVVTDVLTAASVLEQAIKTAVLAYELPHEWPAEVARDCARMPKSVARRRYNARVDLCQLPLVTIDGVTAKDFDDAVFAKPQGTGWRLVVAIADVAHYVKPGSALDREALTRGTSTYFPERVIPMLPEVLSNELCSLQPEVDRLALVCDMHIGEGGQIAEHAFYEAVIHSHARLTYDEVEEFLVNEASAWSAEVQRSVQALHEVYKVLRSARENRGALDFPTHEGALRLQHGVVAEVTPVVRLTANQLIEEAMIAANVSAARFLEHESIPSLYRVHAPPDAAKLEELRQILAYAGVRLPAGDVAPRDLQRALMNLPETVNRWVYGQVALRSMQQAVYTPENQGHYGLALQEYMHFTSPIRRYPDLLVHRAIKSAISYKDAGSTRGKLRPSMDELVWLGEQTSQTERRAESAGWMVDGWLKCDHLLDRVGDVLDGTIATVVDFGLFVELEGYFVQGLVHVSTLGGDYFHFRSRSMSLVGEKSGQRFVMGDRVRVRIQEIQPAQGKIDLLIEGAQSASRRGRRGKRGRSGPRVRG
jgi:ribonuclease R